MGIAFGSINTGLPKDIVQQIVEAEKIPLKKMEAKKAKVENKKALVVDLTKRVEDMRGAILSNKGTKSFREMLVNISDETILTGTVDKNLAEPGTYEIEVLQLAQKSSAISHGVEDPDETYIGVGYMSYELPDGTEKEVYINESSASLNGVAKLINKDKENGMHATVVNDGSDTDKPWKIIIALEDTGDGHKADFPYLYLVDGEVDLYLEGHKDAHDAKIKLDGFEIEVPENTVNDLIPGLSLDLKHAKPGEIVTVEIKEDSAKITEKITALVEKVNEVLKFIKEQNNLNESSDTTQTLGGDITLQTLESRLRTAVFNQVNTDWGPGRIGDLGVTFQRDGLLKMDPEAFNTGLQKNYEKAAEIVVGKFTADGGKVKGFIDFLDEVATHSVRLPSGTLAVRKQGLESNIAQIDRRIENKMRQIGKKEEMLKAKFARLEETISRIKSQGNGLAGMGGGAQVPQLG